MEISVFYCPPNSLKSMSILRLALLIIKLKKERNGTLETFLSQEVP